MTWQLWVVVGFNVLVLISQPFNLGKPRDPRTESDAIVGTIITVIVIALIFWGAQ